VHIIDAHLHLFDLAKGDYHWLKSENPPYWSDKYIIQQDFTEGDFKLSATDKLTGFVHIEAGFNNLKPWREIAWLEDQCQFPFRSVASIDLTLTTAEFSSQLEKLLSFKSVVGCRYILDESAEELLNEPNTLVHLKLLANQKLSFDVQMPLSNLTAVKLLDNIMLKVPKLTVIIDHAGWPSALSTNDENKAQWVNWQQGIKILSQHKNCAIKCSGWEMTDRNFSSTWLTSVIDACINTFGDKRVMLASNFPLCLFSHSYQDVWQSYQRKLKEKYSLQQCQALFCNNAQYWYRF